MEEMKIKRKKLYGRERDEAERNTIIRKERKKSKGTKGKGRKAKEMNENARK